MITLKKYQVEAVDNLVQNTYRLAKRAGFRQPFVFKAPTGAGKTVMMAAFLNKYCEELPDKLDLEPTIPGEETTVFQYQGCSGSTSVDFWRVDGAGHSPVISKFFASEMIAWLMIHPKLASDPQP